MVMMLLGKFLKKKNKYLETQGKSKFSDSLGHALDGVSYATNNERNLKIEIVFGLLVSIAGFLFSISVFEWIVIVLTIAMVITLCKVVLGITDISLKTEPLRRGLRL